MKKLLLLLLSVLLLSCLAGCSAKEKIPLEGMTGIGLYNEFIDTMDSGELYKLQYSTYTWYDFITSTSTSVKFRDRDDGSRELLYREREPFVFWYYPPYDYYDGETYYYKYKDNWFTDRFSKYDRVQQRDFIGLRERFLTGNDTISDAVYQDGRGYRCETVIQSKDKNIYYSMVGQVGADRIFSTIKIKQYIFDYDKRDYVHTRSYYYRYSGINKGREVKRPRGL